MAKVREASSLILTALKQKPFNSLHNYDILTLKRSGKSKFMPNGYVFPGGAVDNSDCDLGWLSLFRKLGVAQSSLQELTDNSETLPEMFRKDSEDTIPSLISLRIAAIRETFEEAGILLARSKNFPTKREMYAESFSAEDLNAWRIKVRENSANFIGMCQSLSCIPDIWGLRVWSNWLTPKNFESKRFDTSFFTACLSEQPSAIADNQEIETILWRTPGDLLSSANSRRIWLPPPQFYEISRIFPFCMLEDFAAFSHDRERHGFECITGIHMKSKEGTFLFLAGDDFFGETDAEKFKDCTFAEVRKLSKNMHRLEINLNDGFSNVAVSNVKPTHGHILPVQISQDSKY